MKLSQIISVIEERLPRGQAEDFDNVGLLCGNPERDITGILVCHDALESVVDEAIEKGLNLIVAFHPIIFSGLKSITGNNYVERAVMKVIENRIALYAIHTVWDNDYFGVNYRIAEELGLQNRKILMPKKNILKQLAVYVPPEYSEQVRQAVFKAGAGNIGFYDECSFSVPGSGTFRPLPGSDPFEGKEFVRENTDEQMLYFIFEDFKKPVVLRAMMEAHPYEEVAYQVFTLENEHSYMGLGCFGDLEKPMSEKEFLQMVKERFGLKVIRHSESGKGSIQRVGVLGGSGAGGIKAARANKCDAYLTGDVKYHDFFQSEGKMMICDIGHFESEQFVTQQLFELLSEKFPKFAISKSQENTNPVNYFL